MSGIILMEIQQLKQHIPCFRFAVTLVDFSRPQGFPSEYSCAGYDSLPFFFVQEKLKKALEEVSALPLHRGSELRKAVCVF